ncbi:MAG: autotransporter-associated beta strand repeat-containing protein [Verrucomicrobia bacterium]|nr:autotransporter-associated beta strand repeat-containing protein [Verrucomicrobiota bacterium]
MNAPSAGRRTLPLALVSLLATAALLRAATFTVDLSTDAAPNSGGQNTGPNRGDLRWCLLQALAVPDSTITITVANVTLQDTLPFVTASVFIESAGTTTIDAGGRRPFFVDAPGSTLTLTRLVLRNCSARGGNGGAGGGGGGLGAGAAIFVNRGNCVVRDTHFADNLVSGGNGGAADSLGGGGGGGLGGSGGTADSSIGGGGGGGFWGNAGSRSGGGGGLRGDGGSGVNAGGGSLGGGGGGGTTGNGGNAINQGGTAVGGAPGVSNGGQGGTGSVGGNSASGDGGGGGGGPRGGGNGGRFGGGGGAANLSGATPGNGGEFGGGGGTLAKVVAGHGGFGGGGGALPGANLNPASFSGRGGFGAGSGGVPFANTVNTPGTFGGAGGVGSGGVGGGGGGAALGGNIFVRDDNGATLELRDSNHAPAQLTAGLGGGSGAGNGQALGSAIFLSRGDTSLYSGNDMYLDGGVADGGAGVPSGRLVKIGPGRLTFSAPNTHNGGTVVTEGELRIWQSGDVGGGPLHVDGVARVNLEGPGLTVGRLTGTGEVSNFFAGAQSFVINHPTVASPPEWFGAIRGGLSVIKTGSGTQVLRGIAYNTGGWDIVGGTLRAFANSGSVGTFPGSGRVVIPDRNVPPTLPAKRVRVAGSGAVLEAVDQDPFGYYDDNAAILVENNAKLVRRYQNLTPGSNGWATLQCVVLNSGSLEADATAPDGAWYLNGPIFSVANPAASLITTPYLILKPGYYGSGNYPAGAPSYNDTYISVGRWAGAAFDLQISSTIVSQPGPDQFAPLNKYGPGTLRLTGRSTYAGATNIQAGTVIAAATNQLNGTFPGSGRIAVPDPNVLPTLPFGVNVFTGATLLCDGHDALGFGDGNPLVNVIGGTLRPSSTSGSDHVSLQFTVLQAGGVLTGSPTQSGVYLNGPLFTTAGSATATISGTRVQLADGFYGISNFPGGAPSYNHTYFSVAAGTAPGGIDLEISSVLSGTAPLIKHGPGTLRLSSGNTYTGNTQLAQGVLQVRHAGAFGPSGLIEFKGGTLKYETINTDFSGRFAPLNGSPLSIDTAGIYITCSQPVSGTGGVRKLGDNTLRLAGANTFQGDTVLEAGVLEVGSASALGTAGAIRFRGGTLTLAFTGTDLSPRFEAVPAGQTIRIDTTGSAVFAAGLSGAGSFDKLGMGTIELAGANNLGGSLLVHDGSLTLTGTNAIAGGATIFPGGQLQIGNNGTTGSFTGAILNTGQLAFRRSDSFTYPGSITGFGAVSHSGGNLTLSGASTGTGTFSVLSGVLTVPGSYTGAFNVSGGARIALSQGSLGSNALAAVVQANGLVDGGGTLRGAIVNAGTIATSQTLAVTGTLTNNAGATLRAASGGTLNLSGLGTLVNNGVIDMITGTVLLPANFSNNGTILDASVVKVKTMSRAGSVTTVTIDSYSGHSYQLQKSTGLTTAFANVGSLQNGASGSTLTFQDTDSGGKVFYRVKVD